MDTWHHLTSCKKPAPCALRLKVRVNRWCIHGCGDRLHKTTSIHEEDLPILPQRQETTWQLKSREDSLQKNCRWCTCLDGSSWWFIHVLSHHQTNLCSRNSKQISVGNSIPFVVGWLVNIYPCKSLWSLFMLVFPMPETIPESSSSHLYRFWMFFHSQSGGLWQRFTHTNHPFIIHLHHRYSPSINTPLRHDESMMNTISLSP